MISLEDIQKAEERIRGQVLRTPLKKSQTISDLRDYDVWVKHENFQLTGSFKARGALNKLLMLSDDERRAGVIAASAGNHAQGVAYHAKRLGIDATIVMPEATPLIKVTATAQYGANTVLHGASFQEAVDHAKHLVAKRNAIFISAYDDEYIIAGQGTIGLEMLEDCPNLDVVVVPVGGGGLISGIACAIKSLKPSVRIIGVEAAVMPSMKMALTNQQPVTVNAHPTLAEGIAVGCVGYHCLKHVEQYVDEIVTVSEDDIARGILYFIEREKTVAEGAGAAAMAALIAEKIDGLSGCQVVTLNCGGNIDVNLLSKIIERGLIESGRAFVLTVTAEDRPGALAKVLSRIAELGANVKQIHHERIYTNLEVGKVSIELELETRGKEHIADIKKGLEASGYTFHSEY